MTVKIFKILFVFGFLYMLGCSENATGKGPTVLLQGVPNGVFEVGSVVSITVSAQADDGSELSFDYAWKPQDKAWTVGERATFLKQKNSALFSWDPLASDAIHGVPIQIIFIVTDDNGRRTEKIASIDIVAGNGKPVFSSNVSEIYDPRTGTPLTFEVKVKDQDSSEVDIRMDEATIPKGATFTKTGPFSGTFAWKPTLKQLEQKHIRTVRFIADDHQFAAVNHDVTIVIRKNQTVDIKRDQTDEICPAGDIITHTPLGPQRGFGDYRIEAKITNASRFDKIVLFSTYADAFNAAFDSKDEKEKLIATEMVEKKGVFVADIRSLAGVTDPNKGYLNVYYQICAIDNDAQSENAIVCTPSTGDIKMFYTFIAYLPDAAECVEDAKDQVNGDDSIATAIAAGKQWSTQHICESNLDYVYTESQSGEKSFLAIAYNQGDNLQVEVLDQNGNSLILSTSICMGLAIVDTTVPVGGSTKKTYLKISGNNVAYHVRKFTLSKGTADTCADVELEPNNKVLDASLVSNGDAIDAEICGQNDIDIYKILLRDGDKITLDHSFDNEKGNLDMTLFSPNQVDDVSASGRGVKQTFGFIDQETITYNATNGGPHYVLVFNNNPTKNLYNLKFKVEKGVACDRDQFANQNNHSHDSAVILPAADIELNNLEVCGGKADWFKRTEFNGIELLGSIEVTGGEGSIDDMTWELFDENKNLLHKAIKKGNQLEIEFTPSSQQALWHKITSTKKVNYSLLLLR